MAPAANVTGTVAWHAMPAGTEMTVSTTLRVEHGYEGVLSAGEKKSPNVSNTTAVFRKQQ